MFKYLNQFIEEIKNNKEMMKGSIISFLFKVFGYLLGLIIILLISKNYGSKGLGIYSLSFTILSILVTISCFGFDQSILRFITEYIGKNEKKKIYFLYKTIKKYILSISIILGLFLFLFSNWINNFFQENIPFKIIAFVIPFSAINILNIQFIRSFRIIKISEFFRNVSIKLLGIIILIILISFISNIYIPIISISIAIIITFFLSNYYIKNKLLINNYKQIKKVNIKKLLNITFPIFISCILALLLDSTDIIILGLFSNIQDVGIYSLCLKLTGLISIIYHSIIIFVVPKISQLYWAKKSVKKIIKFTSRIILILSLPLLIVVILVAPIILKIFGEEFIKGHYTLIILAISTFINGYVGWVGALFKVIGLEKTFMKLIFFTLILDIILDILLVLKFGMIGVAISTLISTTIIALFSVIIIRKKLK